jgi:DNA-binding CsgD family transcriptional regulator
VTDEELFSKMTSRQRQCASLLISGGACDNQSIATIMGVQYETVRVMMTRLLNLTGADNRAALAVFLLRRPVLTSLLDGVVVAPRQARFK